MLIIVLLILLGVLVEKSVIVILQENMHVNSFMYMMRIGLFFRNHLILNNLINSGISIIDQYFSLLTCIILSLHKIIVHKSFPKIVYLRTCRMNLNWIS